MDECLPAPRRRRAEAGSTLVNENVIQRPGLAREIGVEQGEPEVEMSSLIEVSQMIREPVIEPVPSMPAFVPLGVVRGHGVASASALVDPPRCTDS